MPQQAAGQHGVENGARDKIMMLAQQPQIVIRSVHYQLMLTQGLKQWFEIDAGKGIYQFVSLLGGDLNEANFFRVGVKAVRFGVQRYPRSAAEVAVPGNRSVSNRRLSPGPTRKFKLKNAKGKNSISHWK